MQVCSQHILAFEISGPITPVTLRIPYIIAAVIAAISIAYLASPPGLRAAPLLTVTSLDNEQFDLAAMDGKTRLVMFMSPDCPVTNKNLPVLDTVKQHYGEALEVVGVTMPYDPVKTVNQFRGDRNIRFQLVADTDGRIADAFAQVRFTPTSFLIDGQGNIVQRIIGRLHTDRLRSQIDTLATQRALAQKL